MSNIVLIPMERISYSSKTIAPVAMLAINKTDFNFYLSKSIITDVVTRAINHKLFFSDIKHAGFKFQNTNPKKNFSVFE